jgi:hypothetical protein
MSATEGGIVGIEQATNGRSREMHGVCGLSLQVRDMVVFQMRDVIEKSYLNDGIAHFKLIAMESGDVMSRDSF